MLFCSYGLCVPNAALQAHVLTKYLQQQEQFTLYTGQGRISSFDRLQVVLVGNHAATPSLALM